MEAIQYLKKDVVAIGEDGCIIYDRVKSESEFIGEIEVNRYNQL